MPYTDSEIRPYLNQRRTAMAECQAQADQREGYLDARVTSKSSVLNAYCGSGPTRKSGAQISPILTQSDSKAKPMSDLIKRLRNDDNGVADRLLNEAADEIERLRAVILGIARVVENPWHKDDRALQRVRDLTDKHSFVCEADDE